jgi:hypothetical protein
VANARAGLSEGQGLGLVLRRRVAAQACTIVPPLIILGAEIEGDRNGLVPGDCLTPLGHPCTVGCVGQRLTELGQGLRAVGLVHLR